MRRAIFTAHPPVGDFVLRTTGLSWQIDRIHDDDSVARVSTGQRLRTSAMASLLSLAAGEHTDAWEAAGLRWYRLIKRHRVPA